MDLLFKRYADPFSLVTPYIQTGRFCEFINGFLEQKLEDDRWDFYLHKVWKGTFMEFCESLKVTQDLQQMSDVDIEATIKKSMDILGNFNPPQEEGEV